MTKSKTKSSSRHLEAVTERKKELTNHLCDILAPVLVKGLQALYQEGVQANSRNPLKDFQSQVSKIDQWSQERVSRETEKVKCEYFEDLVQATFGAYARVMLGRCDITASSSVNLRVPSAEHFLHKCYLTTGRELYLRPYLVSHQVRPLEQQQNLYEMLSVARSAVKTALRGSLPMESLLRAINRTEPTPQSESESESETESESEAESESESESEESEEEEPQHSDPESEESEAEEPVEQVKEPFVPEVIKPSLIDRLRGVREQQQPEIESEPEVEPVQEPPTQEKVESTPDIVGSRNPFESDLSDLSDTESEVKSIVSEAKMLPVSLEVDDGAEADVEIDLEDDDEDEEPELHDVAADLDLKTIIINDSTGSTGFVKGPTDILKIDREPSPGPIEPKPVSSKPMYSNLLLNRGDHYPKLKKKLHRERVKNAFF